MDEDMKICENCNREIPAVNFTIHSVHCSRNIRMCPVCKEPVPLTELEAHSEKLHKLLPCKQCGEKVCGTDMEDHIRDSCEHTIKSCRWCELELSRRELPLHEGYCGARTEQCPECREYVMHKYRQIHLDSNHGFVRLDDDPAPRAARQRAAAERGSGMPPAYNRPANRPPRLLDPEPGAQSIDPTVEMIPGLVRLCHLIEPTFGQRQANPGGSNQNVFHNIGPRNGIVMPTPSNYEHANTNGQRWPNGNLNIQRNRNGTVTTIEVQVKPVTRGSVKKRKAPKPPNATAAESQPADPPVQQAVPGGRTYSLFPSDSPPNTPVSGGLVPRSTSGPLRGPVPDHLEDPFPDPIEGSIRGPTRGQIHDPIHGPIQGPILLPVPRPNHGPIQGPSHGQIYGRNRPTMFTSSSINDNVARANINGWPAEPKPSIDAGCRSRDGHARSIPGGNFGERVEIGRARREELDKQEDFRNIKPMSMDEFMDRFKQLQLGNHSRQEEPKRTPPEGDRFKDIKSSLKELRRELNEVTAPYNNNNNNANDQANASREKAPSRPGDINSPDSDESSEMSDEEARVGEAAGDEAAGGEAAGGDEAAGGEAAGGDDMMNVNLPCEFCGMLVPANDLVQHQTGCRPDLAQLRPSREPQRRHRETYIPCEFCLYRLPWDLITDHQKRCGRKYRQHQN